MIMRPVDRVIATLYHEEPDMVPLAEEFMTWEAEKLFIDHLLRGAPDWLQRRLIAIRWWGNDIVTVGGNAPDMLSEVLVHEEGERGYTIRRKAYGSIDYTRMRPYFYKVLHTPVRWPEDLDRIEPPDLEEFRPHVEALAREVKFFKEKGYFIETFHNGPFVTVWQYLRGFETFLKDITRNPNFARRLIDFAMEIQVEVTKMIIDVAEVDAVRIGGDLGTTTGLFFSPRVYREIFHPWFKRLVDTYHKKGIFVFRHCHGNINPILDYIVSEGFDSLDPLDPYDGIDLAEVKEKYGDKIALRGGITGHIGAFSLEQLREHVASRFRIGAPGGGYILMCAGGVPHDMPREHVYHYRELINKLRKYPRIRF